MPKSSFQPTVRVWQGGSGEGQIWGEGCVQSSTQTAGGVFQGDKVCVCRPEHEPVRPFDLKWHLLNPRGEKLQPIRWSVTSQINPKPWCLPPLGQQPLILPYCVCSRPHEHTAHTYRPGTLIPTWTPHFKAFIYLVYHQRIWGIWWTISLLHPTVDEEKSLNQLIEKWKQKETEKETKWEVRGQFTAGNPKSPSSLLPLSFLSIM